MAGVGTENIPIRATDTAATLDGKNVRVGQVISTAGGKAVVSLDGGGTAELSSLTFADPEIAKVYEAAATHGVNAARALVEGYDGSLSTDDYVKAANQYIRAGKARLSKKEVAKGACGSMIENEVTRASLYQSGKRDAAGVRIQLGATDSVEPQAAPNVVSETVPELSAPEPETPATNETVPPESESSPNSPETAENGVDPGRENGYDEGNGAGETAREGRKFTAEEISKEFGRDVPQDHVDAHQEVYRRYYKLKEQGLSHSEINDKLLDEMLKKSVDNPETKFNNENALDVKISVAKAYQRSAEIDSIDRDSFYNIKNGLIPYEPKTQFPNAYKIYNEKFTSKTDLGVFVSNILKNKLEIKYNAWGRESKDGKH